MHTGRSNSDVRIFSVMEKTWDSGSERVLVERPTSEIVGYQEYTHTAVMGRQLVGIVDPRAARIPCVGPTRAAAGSTDGICRQLWSSTVCRLSERVCHDPRRQKFIEAYEGSGIKPIRLPKGVRIMGDTSSAGR